MAGYQPDKAAAALHEARQRRTQIAPLPAAIAPRTEAEGAAVQYALAVRAGAASPATSPGGFKIGATARRMQEYLGLSGPAAGFMAVGNLHRSGAAVRFADYLRPGVECELAVRLARDLPPGPCTREQAAEAVGELFAGIEIVENRYGDIAVLGTPTLIADQVYHGAAVLGEPGSQDWRSLDVATLRGRLVVDGQVRDEGVGADLMGHPLNCLAWLAGSSVAAAFGGLKAGQVVMLGSVTPPVWLTGPASVTVDFAPLPLVQVRLD
jgi:2-keto-4-pentenoate hydratase